MPTRPSQNCTTHTTMNVMYAIGDSAMCQLIFIAFYTMDCYLRMRTNMLRVLTLHIGITGVYCVSVKRITMRAQSSWHIRTFLHVRLERELNAYFGENGINMRNVFALNIASA